MSSWLTLVIGIILGLLFGWLIDMLYRRRADKTESLEPAETRGTPPDWAAPLPAELVPATEAVAAVAAVEPEAEEHLVKVEPPEEPSEPAAVQPASAPEMPAAPPPEAAPLAGAAAVAVASEARGEPEKPVATSDAVAASHAAQASGLLGAAALVGAAATHDEPPEPVQPEAPLVAAVAAAEATDVPVESEPVDWPEVSDRLAEVVPGTEGVPEVESAIGRVAPAEPEAAAADTLEAGDLPPAAVAALAATAVEEGAPDSRAQDKLTLIEGIGAVYEAKLNAAGVYTFRQLVEAGSERLREIIQPQAWQRVNFSEWVDQARLILEGKDDELKALQAHLFSKKHQ